MRSSRRDVLAGMGGLVASPFVAGASFGQDAEIRLTNKPGSATEFRLKLHHFLARNGNVPAKFITPWTRKIETSLKAG